MANASTHPSSIKEDRKGSDAMDKAKEVGSEALDKAKGMASSVGDMASQTASAVGKKADDLTSAAGHGIKEFGESIGRKGPHEGLAGQASHAVAETIKSGGKYFEDAKLSGMAHDVEQLIKDHPIPILLIGIGLGYCVGRAMKD